MSLFEDNLKKYYHMVLPSAPPPGGSYVPVKKSGHLLFIAGQTAKKDGKLIYKGKVGKDLNIDQARESAIVAVLNCISQIKAYLGNLDDVNQVIQLIGFVQSSEGFNQQPQVIDAASEMLIQCFGESGKHTRLALGTNELPGGSPVEITMTLEIK